VDRSRFESFSDGVFAVAITLLALDLAVAGPGHGSLLAQLGHHWPSFAAYVVSFFMIGIIWVNHHALVQNIAVVNRTLLYLNLLLLMFVVAIPFATATMAAYLTSGERSNAEVAAAVYALALEAMGLSFALLYEWTLRDLSPAPHLRGHRQPGTGQPPQDSAETTPTSRTLRRPAGGRQRAAAWHRFHLRPEPQVQSSLRPRLASALA